MSDVVEAMALGIANVRRAVFNLPPVEFLTTVDPTMREQLRTEARAALAAVAPLIAAQERERCATVADMYAADPDQYSSRREEAMAIAAAIRALGDAT